MCSADSPDKKSIIGLTVILKSAEVWVNGSGYLHGLTRYHSTVMSWNIDIVVALCRFSSLHSLNFESPEL